jgi:hypothetical protein
MVLTLSDQNPRTKQGSTCPRNQTPQEGIEPQMHCNFVRTCTWPDNVHSSLTHEMGGARGWSQINRKPYLSLPHTNLNPERDNIRKQKGRGGEKTRALAGTELLSFQRCRRDALLGYNGNEKHTFVRWCRGLKQDRETEERAAARETAREREERREWRGVERGAT